MNCAIAAILLLQSTLLLDPTQTQVPMSETYLTAESEEVLDTTNFSVMSLIGFCFALAGVFSLQYVQMMPVAILGGGLGAAVLILAKRFQLSYLSRTLGFLALVIATTTASYRQFYQTIENNYELTQACRISEKYLEHLSKNEPDEVFSLVGFPPEAGPEMPGAEPESPTMKRLSEDPAHTDIRGRKNPPKWIFVTLESEFASTNGHTYKLIYKDEGQTNPPYYSVVVRKNCAKSDNTKKTVNWFVDKLEIAKKQ